MTILALEPLIAFNILSIYGPNDNNVHCACTVYGFLVRQYLSLAKKNPCVFVYSLFCHD